MVIIMEVSIRGRENIDEEAFTRGMATYENPSLIGNLQWGKRLHTWEPIRTFRDAVRRGSYSRREVMR